MKSPADGLSAHYWDQVIGGTLLRPLAVEENISFDSIARGEAE
jgi:hypothetical protein